MHRSALMVAGDKEKFLDKLPNLKCDIAIVNLEDGVFDKNYARELVCSKLQNVISNAKVVVRINALDECGREDIKALNRIKPDAIRVPKIKTPEDVKLATQLIDEAIEIHLSVETKEAFDNLTKLKLDERITTVYLGILDMLESLNLPQSLLSLDNPTIDYILSKFLIDSKITGFDALCFTYQEYENLEEFELWCKKAKKMGYEGTSCISPKQVEIANRVFAFDDEAIKRAKYIVKIFEEQRSKGCTGFADEKYGFIDEPIYKDALRELLRLS